MAFLLNRVIPGSGVRSLMAEPLARFRLARAGRMALQAWLHTWLLTFGIVPAAFGSRNGV